MTTTHYRLDSAGTAQVAAPGIPAAISRQSLKARFRALARRSWLPRRTHQPAAPKTQLLPTPQRFGTATGGPTAGGPSPGELPDTSRRSCFAGPMRWRPGGR